MRSASFVYSCILLPPLFLFRLCLPRPPELKQDHWPANKSFGHSQIGGLFRSPGALNSWRSMYVDIPEKNGFPTALHVKQNDTASDEQKRWLRIRRSSDFKDNSHFSRQSITARGHNHISSSKRKTHHTNHHLTHHSISYRTGATRHKFLRHRHRNRSRQRLRRLNKSSEHLSPLHFSPGRNVGIQTESVSEPHIDISGKNSALFLSHDTRRTSSESHLLPHNLHRRPPKTTPPEYMIHLYHMLSGTHVDALRDTVFTSFVNIVDSDAEWIDQTKSSRKRTLGFDLYMTRILLHAELRLFVGLAYHETSSQNDNQAASNATGKLCSIAVFDILANDKLHLIGLKTLSEIQSAWLSFDVTSAVQTWPTSGLRLLEVRVVSGTFPASENKDLNKIGSANTSPALDIYVEDGKEPLLVVFSKQRQNQEVTLSRRKRRDTNAINFTGFAGQMDSINHGNSDSYAKSQVKFGEEDYQYSTFVDAKPLNFWDSQWDLLKNIEEFVKSNNYAKDTPFAQNGSHGIRAGNSTFLSLDHALRLQDNVPGKKQQPPREASGKNDTAKPQHLPRNYQLKQGYRPENGIFESQARLANYERARVSETALRLRARRDTKARYRRQVDSVAKKRKRKRRRSKRSKNRRNSCRRVRMNVNFQDLKWDKIIYFPSNYEAFQCTGKCYYPIGEYLTPTHHAIIQTLWHVSHPKMASRACCVPTKLSPISILLVNATTGSFEYEYSYEEMVVEECGCR